MDKDDFSAMRRELFYQEFMIRYLQDEQKRRWEELNELERVSNEIKRDLERLQNDPSFKKLVKLAAKKSAK
jgi:DeoR/GlpR family transcriptional regulator of sugar metabolism